MEQLDLAGRAGHQRIVNPAARKHRAHRNDTVGDPLGGGDEIWRDAEIIGGKGRAETAEPGDHLIEDQQDAVLVAQRAQALQIALRRDQHAGRTGDRLDDDGGNGFSAVQRDQTLDVIGEFRAVRGLAPGEGVAGEVVGMALM